MKTLEKMLFKPTSKRLSIDWQKRKFVRNFRNSFFPEIEKPYILHFHGIKFNNNENEFETVRKAKIYAHQLFQKYGKTDFWIIDKETRIVIYDFLID